MNHASTPCQQATIVDTENGASHAYHTLAVKLETPGIYPKHQHPTARAYLIYWPGGVVAHLFTRRGLTQIQPDTIDALYRKATHLRPLDERGQAQ